MPVQPSCAVIRRIRLHLSPDGQSWNNQHRCAFHRRNDMECLSSARRTDATGLKRRIGWRRCWSVFGFEYGRCHWGSGLWRSRPPKGPMPAVTRGSDGGSARCDLPCAEPSACWLCRFPTQASSCQPRLLEYIAAKDNFYSRTWKVQSIHACMKTQLANLFLSHLMAVPGLKFELSEQRPIFWYAVYKILKEKSLRIMRTTVQGRGLVPGCASNINISAAPDKTSSVAYSCPLRIASMRLTGSAAPHRS